MFTGKDAAGYGLLSVMKTWFPMLVLLAAVPMRAAAAPPLGPHPEACAAEAGGTAVLVHVRGFKDTSGNVRVDLYPAVEGEFLAPHARLRAEGKVNERIDVPAAVALDGDICVKLPGPGTYAIAVLHDRNGSGKLDAFSDGYGFPNNPRLGYGKPEAAEAAFTADVGVTRLDIVLNYWNGLAARPLRSAR
ncbi:MAG: DUF2141 domain-containing protein [Rhodospirillaceae bacterium]|nr:DUF2141 domain-containing protein [Rhodospirillaceae bacterium]